MLPNNAIVEQVYSGPDGILSTIKEVGTSLFQQRN